MITTVTSPCGQLLHGILCPCPRFAEEGNPRLRAALNLARLGGHVLPIWWIRDGACACGTDCPKPGKHPLGALVPNGLTNATTDEATIRSWFVRYPDANIALAMERSGLIALDVDYYHGDRKKLAALEAQYGPLPDSVRQRSGSGEGEHLIFRHPGGTVRGIVGEIVVRSRNYIVVAPSNHASGGCYEWLRPPDRFALADLPAAWIEALRRPAAEVGEVGIPDDEPEWLKAIPNDDRVQMMRAHLECEPGEKQGKDRAGMTFDVARTCARGFAVRDPEAVLKALTEIYNPKCVPVWDEARLARKVTEAYRSATSPEWGERLAVLAAVAQMAPTSPTTQRTDGETANPELFDEPEKGTSPIAKAQVYVATYAWHREEGVPLLRRWRGGWYRWAPERGCYTEISDEQVDASLYRSYGLKLCARRMVSDVRHALIGVPGVLIDDVDLPGWIGEDPGLDPLDVATCPNGLLHLPTMQLWPATPRYFTTGALGVPHEPAAPRPERWLAFLRELWGEDEEPVRALQEWFGYLLTPDPRQQKMLLMVGPKRSGKGTILRVLTALLGRDSVAAPTLASLGTNFGLWPLIGKSAAIVSDARLGGRSDIAQITERLLSISGDDSLTVDRKHRTPWTGRLGTRFTIVSNELPRLNDASGALASRMIVLELERSWYGKENTRLTDELLTELPGILGWAIEGWHSLRARGAFVQPESGRAAAAELEALGSPVRAWIAEACEEGPDRHVQVDAAYAAFQGWCVRAGHKSVPSKETFGRDLKAAGYRRVRQRVDGERAYFYLGIAVREAGPPAPPLP